VAARRHRDDSSPRNRAARSHHSSLSSSDPVSALQFLDGLSGYETSGSIAERNTARIEMMTAAMGSPNRRFPSVHISGTNGKGSTSAMVTRLLRSCGLRVGTYTSPHLMDITERIAIDERPISTQRFADALASVAWSARRVGVTPSWFEAVTAAGMAAFADAAVDVAVVEVGMLGRWDATNILDSRVAVITNVELDHTDYAGPTRRHIAIEKAGIIHPGAALVLGENDPDLQPIFLAQNPTRLLRWGVELLASNRRTTADGSLADIATPWGLHRDARVAAMGAHQTRNATLALAAAEVFVDAPFDSNIVSHALGTLKLRGRAEVFGSDPSIIVDGAHNRAAAKVLRSTVDEHFARPSRLVLVCATSGTRDPAEFLAGFGIDDIELVVATECYAHASVPAGSVADAARNLGCQAICQPDVEAAIGTAVATAGSAGLVVIAGSLYLVGTARAIAATIVDPNGAV